jgi:hypothetical protein
MGSEEEGFSFFVVRETHGSLAPFLNPSGGHCTATIESALQVLVGSAHPTCEGFVENGARSQSRATRLWLKRNNG